MPVMILQKLLKSRWLVLSLLAGLVTAVAMVSSIPMYTDGILQRTLVGDLEAFQLRTGKYPGSYLIKKSYRYFSSGEFNFSVYQADHEVITERLAPGFFLPTVAQVHRQKITMLKFLPEIQREDEPKAGEAELEARTDLEEHIRLVHGRLYSSETSNGVYEALATEQAMRDQDLRLNEVYVVSGPEKMWSEPIRIRIVGVFTLAEEQDPYWYGSLSRSRKSFFVDCTLFQRDFASREVLPDTEIEWFYALDYHEINLGNYRQVLSLFDDHSRVYIRRRISFDIPVVPILEEYILKERHLNLTLAFLQVPVLLMLGFFLYMVSLLIIEREKNEIAVLKSRGAGSGQVFLIYLLGNCIVSFMALLIGPPLALLICRILGSTNGFLEFIKRTALPISLGWKAYIFSLVCVVVFMFSILVPAFFSSRTTIVLYKQGIARRRNTLGWRKYMIDVLLIGIALYGYYRYHMQQKTLAITGAEGSDLPIDPLLFLISVVFILGCGLLFLRIFPYLVRFVFWLGRRLWPPALYSSFINVGRSIGYEQFIIIFLVLTVALGVFNASAARTVNKNVADQIYYENGADITVLPSGYGDYVYEAFSRLEGVEGSTPVLRREGIRVNTERGNYITATLMGIVPHQYAEVAWFRSDLLPHHVNNYLNLMSYSPNAVLVSRSLADRHDVAVGDPIVLSWEGQKAIDAVVYQFVDYWPTFNPVQERVVRGGVNLVIANLDYLRSRLVEGTVDVWIKKKEGAPSSLIYQEIEEKELYISDLRDSTQQIIEQKNNPVLLGTNGLLTLGFMVTLGVSLIGFLICWILSIQGRALQFGVVRAIGLARRKVVAIIVWEQLLISLPAVLVGILVGGATAQLFVPMLQIVSSSMQQVPPFVVGALWKDYLNLFIFVAVMFVGVLTVLGVLISRINVHQALKLGEE